MPQPATVWSFPAIGSVLAITAGLMVEGVSKMSIAISAVVMVLSLL